MATEQLPVPGNEFVAQRTNPSEVWHPIVIDCNLASTISFAAQYIDRPQ